MLGKLIKENGRVDGMKLFCEKIVKSISEMDGADKVKWTSEAWDWDGFQATVDLEGTLDDQKKRIVFVAAEHADGDGVGEDLYYWFFYENEEPREWNEVPD